MHLQAKIVVSKFVQIIIDAFKHQISEISIKVLEMLTDWEAMCKVLNSILSLSMKLNLWYVTFNLL